jgi:hypothetical protein
LPVFSALPQIGWVKAGSKTTQRLPFSTNALYSMLQINAKRLLGTQNGAPDQRLVDVDIAAHAALQQGVVPAAYAAGQTRLRAA